MDNWPDNRVIGLSPELVMPREEVQEKSLIPPSAAEWTWMEMLKDEDNKE